MTQPASVNRVFLTRLQEIVGSHNLLTDARSTERYRHGYRSGGGHALAVVLPQTLLQQWRVLQACVAANKIVIMQAANTGLTEGSTPSGHDYDREVVIISTRKLDKLQLINNAEQVIAFPGSTLHQLEKILKPHGREPHSVIGSSCIGASVMGGICNNSGGSLIKRGPAYTELALYAQVDADGQLQLVNHLGIDLGETPEEILTRLEKGSYSPYEIEQTPRAASDHEYVDRVRDVDADTPSRFNADPRRLHEASGCAGKLAVFAVRLDTFPQEPQQQVFYIGTNDTGVLTAIRRHILRHFTALPVAGEYLHRDCFNIAEIYGKDTFLMIDRLGTDRIPDLFLTKGKLDARLNKVPLLPRNMSDRVMQCMSRLLPGHLPARLTDYRDRYAHHLLLKMSGDGVAEAQAFLTHFFQQAEGDFFACTEEEGRKAFLHRFAAAGAAVRYHAVHQEEVEDILALDIALRRNETDWFETLPPEIEQQLVAKLYYGHFMCHVFHQDYIVKKGVDTHALKAQMLAGLNAKGAEYPAEHNVGHLYPAKPALKAFYREIDPTNSFNPGIGKTPKQKYWRA
ncbi:D-lactate dehydrogenase [Chimaeribacter arupi]|uniref:Quinone-dependent D-lactate dehydrogenase n=1 Tax=Nissabacter archeti TaxID=1917880 RepID=A0ABS5JI44_9GAMM|nr:MULTISPECIES: D-lactate dehydrogenase [Yersiniaceae]MBS0969607.1 D-lactate dehydrogenase [Nissabacter archeti]MDV5142346.1 D-lactate dehydrogenase [Chimaeribacter arupi]PLR35292.1 D-lactate dehydrogenase [Chimaeribacter arupi]PLR44088.1 D-lactate dehydrogenase [Chimaeribacter arupi]WKZ91300.1 D-lactate dehydrogenase [Chimaeribacter arupi]